MCVHGMQFIPCRSVNILSYLMCSCVSVFMKKAKQPWAGRVTEVEWEIKIIIAHFTERKRNEKQDEVAHFFTLIESLFSLNHTQSVWDMLHIMNAYIHKQIHDLFSWKINTIALTLGCFALSPPLNMHDHKFFSMHFNAQTDAQSACANHFILLPHSTLLRTYKIDAHFTFSYTSSSQTNLCQNNLTAS